jgi:Type IIB DNA topoisomerase
MDKLWADTAAEEEEEVPSDGGEAEPERDEPERDEPQDVATDDEDTEGAGEAAPLDADACSPQQVIARIEAVTAELATALLAEMPTVPALEMQATGSSGVTNKNLMSKRDAPSTIRLWRVLAELHANLLAGRTATQRELYYALVDGKSVKSATEVNTAILDAARLLRVPRAYLGVTCASRGCVTGSLSIREDSGMWVDLAGGTGRAIPGSQSA